MWSVKCRFWTPESSLSFIWGHFCRGHRGRPLLRAFTIQSSLTVAVSWCCIKKNFELCFSCVVVFSSFFSGLRPVRWSSSQTSKDLQPLEESQRWGGCAADTWRRNSDLLKALIDFCFPVFRFSSCSEDQSERNSVPTLWHHHPPQKTGKTSFPGLRSDRRNKRL